MTIGPTNIGLSWTAPANGGSVSGYTVLQRVTGTGPFSIAAAGLSGTSYEVTGLIPSTSYDFAIFATNGAGPGATSNIVTQTTTGAIPNAPAGLTASAGSPAYSEVWLSWTASRTDSTHGPATGYVVQQSPHGANTWTTIGTPTSTSFTATGLAHVSAYDFQVFATNSVGTSSAASSVATITTDYAPPNAPSINSINPVNDGSTNKLTVTWSAPVTDVNHDAATGSNLQYSLHGASSWTQVNGVTSPYTITGLSAGTSYEVKMQGTNASTTSPGAWSGITTGTTYSTAVTWGLSGQPQSSFGHGSGNINGVDNAGMNANTTPNPSNVYFVAATGNSGVPTSGLVNITYYGSPYNWADYYPVPATPGTYYFWAVAENSGVVVGALVSGAITVS